MTLVDSVLFVDVILDCPTDAVAVPYVELFGVAVAEKLYVAVVLPLTLRVVLAPFMLSVIVPLCIPGVVDE